MVSTMMKDPSPDVPLDDVARWFEQRGFAMVITQDSEAYWAHLLPAGAVVVTVPKYGRGASPAEAAARAQQRYKDEEEETTR
jgi:hypothetical protein